ncbi:unnamed protein product [Amoebophrya sp. A25]|nr:unnamed protein product [Amoebophrya sp. A25]|eukprot:GSA25T00013267001.1
MKMKDQHEKALRFSVVLGLHQMRLRCRSRRTKRPAKNVRMTTRMSRPTNNATRMSKSTKTRWIYFLQKLLLSLSLGPTHASAWIRIEPECGPVDVRQVKVRRRHRQSCFVLYPLLHPRETISGTTGATSLQTANEKTKTTTSIEKESSTTTSKEDESESSTASRSPTSSVLGPQTTSGTFLHGGEDFAEFLVDLPDSSQVWAWSILECDDVKAEISSSLDPLNGALFRVYRDFGELTVTPGEIPGGRSTQLEIIPERDLPKFLPAHREKIGVRFCSKSSGKSKMVDGSLNRNGNRVRVTSPAWDQPEGLTVEIFWCEIPKLFVDTFRPHASSGSLRIMQEESLFVSATRYLDESHLPTSAHFVPPQVSWNIKGRKDRDVPKIDGEPEEEEEDDAFVGRKKVDEYIDADGDHYVLSRKADFSIPTDSRFLRDLCILILSCTFCSVLLRVLSAHRLDMTLGCVVGGSLVGPGGWNLIQEHVQVESVAELGLVFLMFELGFGFSMRRILKSWRAAVTGGIMVTVWLVVFFVLLAMVRRTDRREAALVGIFISVSSTALVAASSASGSRGAGGAGGSAGSAGGNRHPGSSATGISHARRRSKGRRGPGGRDQQAGSTTSDHHVASSAALGRTEVESSDDEEVHNMTRRSGSRRGGARLGPGSSSSNRDSANRPVEVSGVTPNRFGGDGRFASSGRMNANSSSRNGGEVVMRRGGLGLPTDVSLQSNALISILVTQDLILALVLAVFPPLFLLPSGAGDTSASSRPATADAGLKAHFSLSMWQVQLELWQWFALSAAVLLLYGLLRALFPHAVKRRSQYVLQSFLSGSQELQQLLLVFWCLLVILTGEQLGLFSKEVGAFLAGGVLPSSCKQVAEQVTRPLKEFFMLIFFGYIGLMMRPLFLVDNFQAIAFLWFGLTGLKFCACMFHLIACGGQRFTIAFYISLCLSHVGEFAFLILAKGKTWAVFSNKVHLLLLGVATFSLLTSPMVLGIAQRWVRRLTDRGCSDWLENKEDVLGLGNYKLPGFVPPTLVGSYSLPSQRPVETEMQDRGMMILGRGHEGQREHPESTVGAVGSGEQAYPTRGHPPESVISSAGAPGVGTDVGTTTSHLQHSNILAPGPNSPEQRRGKPLNPSVYNLHQAGVQPSTDLSSSSTSGILAAKVASTLYSGASNIGNRFAAKGSPTDTRSKII